MTTIKLIPQVMELEVSLDSVSMPSLFDQSLETTINREITRQVHGRIPTTSDVVHQVVEGVTNKPEFARKIRDWVLEGIDYYDIKRSVMEEINHSEIANVLIEDGEIGENLIRGFMNSNRFRNIVSQYVGTAIDAGMVSAIIEDKLETMSVNLSNEVAEKVLKIIQSRLTIGSDV